MEWMEPSTFGESSIEEDSAGYRDRPARSTFLLLHHAQLRTQPDLPCRLLMRGLFEAGLFDG